MKLPKHLFPLILLFAVSFDARAQENTTMPSSQPPKYRMELVYIFEANSAEYVFVIGNIGFKSLDSLKKYISNMPAGSTLEWAPGCLRRGNEPLLSSEREIKEFEAFCARNKVKFVLVPSG